MSMPKRGRFVVVEGLDGSGKSKQVSLIGDYLKERGICFLSEKEPTKEGPLGKLIGMALKKELVLNPLALQFLFCANRAQHIERVILPAIESSTWVICDRYFYSTIAYGAMDIDFKTLAEMGKLFLQPDIVFLLNVRAGVCLERINKDKTRNGNKEFFEKLDKLEKVRRNYLKVREEFPNIKLIEGERTPEKIFEEIKFYLDMMV